MEEKDTRSLKIRLKALHPKYQHDQFNRGQSRLIGPQTKAIRWKTTIYGISDERSPVIGKDGTIYIQSIDGSATPPSFNLIALMPDGTPKWKALIGTTPAIGKDGTLYYGSDVDVIARNPDGTDQWTYSTGDLIMTPPATGTDGTIYIGGTDGYLYALDRTGTLKWKASIGNPQYYGSPAIGTDGTIYITTQDSKLYSLDPGGVVKWEFNVNNDWITNPAIGPDGTIYVGGDFLYALNPDGSVKWEYTAIKPYSLSAIGSNGVIYVTSYDTANDIYYMDAIKPDGSLKWRYTDGASPFGYSVIGSDGIIYFGSMNGFLYALKPNGQLKWKLDKGGIVHGSPAIGKDGTLYVINANRGGMYAIQDIKLHAKVLEGRFKHSLKVELKMNQPGEIYWRIKGNLMSKLWRLYVQPISLKSGSTLEFYGKNLNRDVSGVYRERC